MNITRLNNGNLLVPMKAEHDIGGETIIWDAMIEINPNDPEYEKYLKMYEHDLLVLLEMEEIRKTGI